MDRSAHACYILDAVISGQEIPRLEPRNPLACFECVVPPQVSLSFFIQRLSPMAPHQLWTPVLVLVDRFLRRTGCRLHRGNVHRLVLTAFAIAAKTCFDCTNANVAVSKAGGTSPSDLLRMEIAFLRLVDWDVVIQPSTFRLVEGSIADMLERPPVPGNCRHPSAGIFPDSVHAELLRTACVRTDHVSSKPGAGTPAFVPVPPPRMKALRSDSARRSCRRSRGRAALMWPRPSSASTPRADRSANTFVSRRIDAARKYTLGRLGRVQCDARHPASARSSQ
eukprot:TRINITY_DN33097_c0_g1_i1.p1 TRINITY_DN33097_c0_g1~~TRINITY_DN33097_c0_g1_i1.p1  ORF type:complete len:280 (+),score=11.33 TRINITY_DN33097_c0_g1_i1:60-899(+)